MAAPHNPGAFKPALATPRNVMKKEPPPPRGLKKLKNKVLGKESDTILPSQLAANQHQNHEFHPPSMQRQPSIPVAQPEKPVNSRNTKVSDTIAHLNKEKEGIERQWSKNTSGVKNDNQQVPVGTASRKPVNGEQDQQMFFDAPEQTCHESTKLLESRYVQPHHVPNTAWVSEPQSFGDHGPPMPPPNGFPPPPRPHDPALRRPSNINRSRSEELLKGALDLAKQEIETLHQQLIIARQASIDAQQFNEDYNSLQQAHNDLLMAETQAVEERQQLQDENIQLKEDVKTWRNNWTAINNDLTQLQTDLTSARKVDDKWFVAQWKDLHIKIEQLSLQYFQGRLSRASTSVMDRVKGSRLEKFEGETSRCLTRLTSTFARYLKSDNERPLIMQAYLWTSLVNNVFDHVGCYDGGFLWAGQSRAALYYLNLDSKPIRHSRHKNGLPLTPTEKQRMEHDTRIFNKWRAETAIMMLAREPVEKRIKNISSDIASLIDEIFEILMPYVVTTKERPLSVAEPDIKSQLRVIIHQAIEMDAEIAQQRTLIFCEQWRSRLDSEPLWGFPWLEAEADKVLTAEQSKHGHGHYRNPCVEMIVQPALWKEGNQFGEGYGKREILCKAKVVVGEDPTSLGSRHV